MGKLVATIIKNVSMIALGGVLTVIAKKGVDKFVYPDAEKYHCGPSEIKEDIRHIDVTWLNGEVSVKTWEHDTIAFVEEGESEISEKDSLYYMVNQKRLYLKFCSSGNIVNIKKKKLTLCVPAELVLDDIHISTTAANVDIFDVIADNIDITTTSGSVLGDVPSSDRVAIKTSSGHVEMNASSCGAMEIKTSSGNIGAYADVLPSYMDLKTISGDVTIKLPAYAKFNPEVTTTSGKVYSEYRYQESNEKLIVKTTSGNIFFIMK